MKNSKSAITAQPPTPSHFLCSPFDQVCRRYCVRFQLWARSYRGGTIHNACITLGWGYSIGDGLFFVPLSMKYDRDGVFLQKYWKNFEEILKRTLSAVNFRFRSALNGWLYKKVMPPFVEASQYLFTCCFFHFRYGFAGKRYCSDSFDWSDCCYFLYSQNYLDCSDLRNYSVDYGNGYFRTRLFLCS